MDTAVKRTNFESTADLTSNTGFQSTLSIASVDEKNEKPYNPFDHRQVPHPNSFTCKLYDSQTEHVNVNEVRKDLFASKNKIVSSLPPTSAVLFKHALRAAYQGADHIWGNALKPEVSIPCPSSWGGTKENESWIPEWSAVTAIWSQLSLLDHCGCKSGCVTMCCGCRRVSLPSTAQCKSCKGGCTNQKTIGSILHLLKACIGSGILAMPAAFKNAGIVVGIIGTLAAGYLCTHTINILVKTSQQVSVDAQVPSLSFAETCGAAFSHGPKRLRGWGNFVSVLIDASLVLTYVSTLCVYVVFIVSSFKEVFDVLLPESQLSIQMYCCILLIPLVLVVQIRNLKYLVPCSALANMLIVVVFSITLYYMFSDLPPVSEREMVAKVSQWPLFLSTVVFAMEGIGVVMPIENEMKKPQQFLGCPGVLNVSMFVVITLYAVFGFFGYLQYGDEVKGSITLNLPDEDMFARVAKLLMAVVIYFTYPLQNYVSMEIITRLLSKRSSNKCDNLIQISIRTFIVAISVGIAASFPNLELVIGFVGAVFFSTLGFLIPAIVETVYRWDRDPGRFNYVIYKNLVIGIFSIFILVSGAYVSIVGIIEEFFSGDSIDSEDLTVI